MVQFRYNSPFFCAGTANCMHQGFNGLVFKIFVLMSPIKHNILKVLQIGQKSVNKTQAAATYKPKELMLGFSKLMVLGASSIQGEKIGKGFESPNHGIRIYGIGS